MESKAKLEPNLRCSFPNYLEPMQIMIGTMPRPQSSIESLFKQSLSNPVYTVLHHALCEEAEGAAPSGREPGPVTTQWLHRSISPKSASQPIRPSRSSSHCSCCMRDSAIIRSVLQRRYLCRASPGSSVIFGQRHFLPWSNTKNGSLESPTQWMLSALIAFRASVVLKFQKVIPFL